MTSEEASASSTSPRDPEQKRRSMLDVPWHHVYTGEEVTEAKIPVVEDDANVLSTLEYNLRNLDEAANNELDRRGAKRTGFKVSQHQLEFCEPCKDCQREWE